MNILGVNINHQTAAALVVDGKLGAAAEEERFNRKKNTFDPPVNAVTACLKFAGLEAADIDYVSVGMDEVRTTDRNAPLGLFTH